MKKQYLSYNPKLKVLAKELRKNSTPGEIILWWNLKNNKIGCDFHRQKPIGEYIVDFFCPELMLAIEIDGYSHIENYQKDLKRQNELEKLGITFLRFKEREVCKETMGVLEAIRDWAEEHGGTHPV